MNTAKLKIGLLIVCATLLGHLVITHLNAADAPASKQMKSAWEYATFDYPPDDSTLDDKLNGMAKQGWEIISVSKYVNPNFGLQACVAVKKQIV